MPASFWFLSYFITSCAQRKAMFQKTGGGRTPLPVGGKGLVFINDALAQVVCRGRRLCRPEKSCEFAVDFRKTAASCGRTETSAPTQKKEGAFGSAEDLCRTAASRPCQLRPVSRIILLPSNTARPSAQSPSRGCSRCIRNRRSRAGQRTGQNYSDNNRC